MTPYEGIQQRLDQGLSVVLAGPMGAELVRRGVRWRGHGMLTDTETVRNLAAEYFEAGADVVRTNTFQLNRRIYLDVFRNAQHMRHIGAPGLETRAVELTRCAVELAIQARAETGRSNAAIAGVMSPLEHCFRPDLAPSAETAEAEHHELAVVLASSGVDLLILESMNTLTEARAAVKAAISTGLPVWVSFVLGPDGQILGGGSLAGAAVEMREAGVRAVMVDNVPVADIGNALSALAGHGPCGASPHLGLYDPPSWKFEFFPRFCNTEEWTAERYAETTRQWTSLGAKIIGTSFGGDPHHTRALAALAVALP